MIRINECNLSFTTSPYNTMAHSCTSNQLMLSLWCSIICDLIPRKVHGLEYIKLFQGEKDYRAGYKIAVGNYAIIIRIMPDCEKCDKGSSCATRDEWNRIKGL